MRLWFISIVCSDEPEGFQFIFGDDEPEYPNFILENFPDDSAATICELQTTFKNIIYNFGFFYFKSSSYIIKNLFYRLKIKSQ